MDLETIDQTSETYLGEWKRLVSTTNWEKGRIIQQWRSTLLEADAPESERSDDAWSRRVGNVTPQHVGRLRRVYERFGSVRETYPGLFWSHFQAALDWDDAELWLEGALQNDWSIGQMRKTRWESMGAPAEMKPRDSDVILAEVDEDAEPMSEVHRETVDSELAAVRSVGDEPDDEAPFANDQDDDDNDAEHAAAETSRPEPKQPFAELPSLPADVTDAFESFKLCILRHRIGGWQEISLGDMLATLDALKELATAPAE